MNDPVKYLVIRDMELKEIWRIPVEGMDHDDIFSLGLNIAQTLKTDYGVSVVR